MVTLFWLKALLLVGGAFLFGTNLKMKRLLSMIILQTTGSAQEVKFIARAKETGTASISLLDETTNITATSSVTLFTDRYYTYFSDTFTLVEGRHYMLTVTYSGTDIYKGKVFCTDQTIADYSINNGVYTERTTTNEYIVFDG